LTSGKFEFTSADRFNDVRFGRVLSANRQQDLSDIDASSDTDRFPVRMSHTGRQTIGAGTTQHFICSQHVVRVSADTDVVPVLTDCLRQVLVDGNTARLERLGRNLLFFVTNQVTNEREQIDRCLLGTDVKNTNLRFGDTTAIPRLDVRFVLLVSVTTSWTATHG
jgi:hypothetical protein